ncbi:thiol-disulfide oxidoreductase DCC family protein [Paraferrimonas haliotis]|uniref:Redox protein n=1 Tax=Paraferrimonas haliotis TaxID=2013866 RepID=A0AA37TRV8_9GAMM|nr:redox protein [Paraferrimonas haliotis]
MLTIFYDSACPLCLAEMRHLQRLDVKSAIRLQDIQHPQFEQRFAPLTKAQAMGRLHGLLDGKLITGLDVTYHAWRLVGRQHWVAPLRWPIIKPLANWGYNIFAKHRYRISYWLTRKQPCPDGRCSLGFKSHKEG